MSDGIEQVWRGLSVAIAATVAGALVYLAARTEPAVAQGGSEVSRVEVVQDTSALLGEGDVRFGVVIEPGGGAVVARWQNFRAYHVDDQGRTRDLGIRLKHRHTGIAIPPNGLVVFQDLQGDYYAITADGRLVEVPGIR